MIKPNSNNIKIKKFMFFYLTNNNNNKQANF